MLRGVAVSHSDHGVFIGGMMASKAAADLRERAQRMRQLSREHGDAGNDETARLLLELANDLETLASDLERAPKPD
jgi:hypothetical protein